MPRSQQTDCAPYCPLKCRNFPRRDRGLRPTRLPGTPSGAALRPDERFFQPIRGVDDLRRRLQLDAGPACSVGSGDLRSAAISRLFSTSTLTGQQEEHKRQTVCFFIGAPWGNELPLGRRFLVLYRSALTKQLRISSKWFAWVRIFHQTCPCRAMRQAGSSSRCP